MSTDEIADAVGVKAATIRRWGRLGVLPPCQIVSVGRRGTQARWPVHSVEQARWVLSKLEAGLTFSEITDALARGDFRAGPEDDPDR